jgi:hypothetical protein
VKYGKCYPVSDHRTGVTRKGEREHRKGIPHVIPEVFNRESSFVEAVQKYFPNIALLFVALSNQ